MKKPWGGRFSKSTSSLVEEFTQSVTFDKRLYREDIAGSIAHARMLAKQNIISPEDAEKIVKGLTAIVKEIENGTFVFRKEQEDIHMAIEARLREKIGDSAGKLHTARSRNDQVALDLRLYLKRQAGIVLDGLTELQKVFVRKAVEYLDVPLPGYTHLQRAQPVLLAHYLLAYVEMWERDKGRFADCRKRFDLSPLGSGALSGTGFPLDRGFVAKELGLAGITANSMDSVSDRDFAIEFLAAASIAMMHLSRLAEDMILWNSHEFRFVDLPDEFCTGSSIMPQKKNPDVLEIVRGKTGRVYGGLVNLLTIMKGLPLTYNRDMQEDKEPLFDAVDTLTGCLSVLASLFERTGFRKERMAAEAGKGFLLATELADYLARKGVPFRDAHEITGRIVAHCERAGRELQELSLAEYKKFSPLFGQDILHSVDPGRALDSRRIPGATGRRPVSAVLSRWRKKLKV